MRDGVEIRILNPDPGDPVLFRHFTEAAWAEHRHNPRIAVTLDDGPAGARLLSMLVRNGIAGRIMADIDRAVRTHRMAGRVRIETGSPGG